MFELNSLQRCPRKCAFTQLLEDNSLKKSLISPPPTAPSSTINLLNVDTLHAYAHAHLVKMSSTFSLVFWFLVPRNFDLMLFFKWYKQKACGQVGNVLQTASHNPLCRSKMIKTTFPCGVTISANLPINHDQFSKFSESTTV